MLLPCRWFNNTCVLNNCNLVGNAWEYSVIYPSYWIRPNQFNELINSYFGLYWAGSFPSQQQKKRLTLHPIACVYLYSKVKYRCRAEGLSHSRWQQYVLPAYRVRVVATKTKSYNDVEFAVWEHLPLSGCGSLNATIVYLCLFCVCFRRMNSATTDHSLRPKLSNGQNSMQYKTRLSIYINRTRRIKSHAQICRTKPAQMSHTKTICMKVHVQFHDTDQL